MGEIAGWLRGRGEFLTVIGLILAVAIWLTSRTDALVDRVGDLEVQFARIDERLGNVEKGNDQLQHSINTLIQLHLNAAADDR